MEKFPLGEVPEVFRVGGGMSAPDATPIKTLKQLNALLAPEAKLWSLRRSPAGYYYFTHPEHAPSGGIYVFSCKGTTLGYWRRELNEHLEREG